jgi:hypothetical protein
MLLIIQILFYKTSFLNEEVNGTEPSPSVRVPCPSLLKAQACQTAAAKIGGKKVFRIFGQAVVRLLDESKASSKMLTIKVHRRDGRIAVYESSRSTGGHI